LEQIRDQTEHGPLQLVARRRHGRRTLRRFAQLSWQPKEIIRIISAGKPISASAESIFGKPPNRRQRAVLARIAKRQARGEDCETIYTDIPALTDEQLAQFRRPPKVLVAARLDRDVYDWLRRYGRGCSTRINHILRAVMSRVG